MPRRGFAVLHMVYLLGSVVCVIAFSAGIATAQETSILDKVLPDGSGTYTGRIVQGLVLLTVLSLAPGLLITMTCFTRFIIAFSFLRSGMGLQSTPSNLIVISLSLFMTFFVMEPVFQKSWNEGIKPLLDNQIEQQVAYERMTEPLKEFMARNVRAADVSLFENFRELNELRSREAEGQAEENFIQQDRPAETGGSTAGNNVAELTLSTLVPAFLLSELRRGFEIGFLILLPFLVIDLVVASVTMSMGMMMLPPTVVALPFKVLFFVLIDGWNMLVGELLQSVSFVN